MKKFLGYGFKIPQETLKEAIEVYRDNGGFDTSRKEAISGAKEYLSNFFPKTPLKKVKIFKAYLVIK